MGKSKVTFNLDFEKKLNTIMNKKTALVVGNVIEKEMKKSISKGLSPVKGVGRFVPYAIQRGIPNGYPTGIVGKNKRPINLKLTGEFLKSLTHFTKRSGSGFEAKIGFKIVNKRISALFETHNEGKHPHVPQRRFVPTKKGERFLVSIERKYIAIITKRLNDVLKSTNN